MRDSGGSMQIPHVVRIVGALDGGAVHSRANEHLQDESPFGNVAAVLISMRSDRLRLFIAHRLSLFGCLRVPDRGIRQPDEVALVVDAVPEPAAAGHLVLPLLQQFAVDRPGSEAPLQQVLAFGA